MTFKSFGRKLSRGTKKFGKKVHHDAKKFGKKAIHQIDVGERKLVNSIDKIAPVAAVGADLYAAGSGDAILEANDGIQGLHKSGRHLVRQLPKLQTKGRSREKVAQFGDDVDRVKKDFNRSKTLLRDVKNSGKRKMRYTTS